MTITALMFRPQIFRNSESPKKEKAIEPVSKPSSSRRSGDCFEHEVEYYLGAYNRKGKLV